jgi:RNA polymerase sigma factor (sigma-70 family)
MTSVRRIRSDHSEPDAPSPTDDFLIACMLGGDHAALLKLMDRYDRLVRYTIFRASRDRCAHDPQWLESVASATWAGFVQSMRRHPDDRPRLLATYLARIARNHTVSAIRAVNTTSELTSQDDDVESLSIAADIDEPGEEVGRLELLEALRACIETLDDDDRVLASQLAAITERRWKDAADALRLKESTLRSRWKRTLERLRECVERKTGETIAPGDVSGDL